MNESAITTFDPEQQKHWAEMAETIKKSASQRRGKRTAPSKVKTRSGGGDKSFKYVDRADYQIWLDDNFPGWTIEEYKVWTERSVTSSSTTSSIQNLDKTITTLTKSQAQDIPMLFCVSFMLVVIESGMAKRRIPCIGTASVAEKELGRDNAQLLKQKYNSATTEAYKMGCNWLGAFFDLRADVEEREKAASPATPEQFAKFTELLNKVPVAYKDETTKAWNKMNASTADTFIKGLEDKLNKLTPKE